MDEVDNIMRIAGKPLSAIAILINALLIYTISVHSTSFMGNYKYLMIYIAVVELSFGFLDFFHIPIIFTKDSECFLMINLKESRFPYWLATFMNVTFYGFFGATMNMLCIHFIYRYASVKRTNFLKTFDSWKLLVWFSLPLINGAIWVFFAAYFFRRNDTFDHYLFEDYSAKRHFRASDYSYFGAMFHPKKIYGDQNDHWNSIEGCLMVLALIVLSIVTIIYFGVRCYAVLRRYIAHSSESIRYKKLQEQLFYALVFQTLIPMVLLHIPSSLVVFTLILDVSEEWAGKLLSSSIAFYPAINPIPTLFVVDSYRKALLNYFRELKCVLTCRPLPVEPTTTSAPPSMFTHSSSVSRTVQSVLNN